jgi:hypothetical protein
LSRGYGQDLQITEYGYGLGAALEGPVTATVVSGSPVSGLYSRHFANYTVYANANTTSVTIPTGASLASRAGVFIAA